MLKHVKKKELKWGEKHGSQKNSMNEDVGKVPGNRKE